MIAGVVEIVIYKIKKGVNEDEHITRAIEVAKSLSKLDGFVGRNFTKDSEGKWVDLVYWKDMTSAKNAASVFPTLPECQEFLADINEDDIQYIHTSVLKTETNELIPDATRTSKKRERVEEKNVYKRMRPPAP
jgi:hypothetical protein